MEANLLPKILSRLAVLSRCSSRDLDIRLEPVIPITIDILDFNKLRDNWYIWPKKVAAAARKLG